MQNNPATHVLRTIVIRQLNEIGKVSSLLFIYLSTVSEQSLTFKLEYKHKQPIQLFSSLKKDTFSTYVSNVVPSFLFLV